MKALSSRLIFAPLCLVLLATSAHAGEDADFRKANGYYTLGEFKLAAEAFEKYLAENAKSERADQAQLFLGESHYQLKQYADAAAAFDKCIAVYPQSTRRNDAVLRAIKAHFLIKEYDKSLKAAETFLAENQLKFGKPDMPPGLPPQIANALYYAGECNYALKNPAQAKLYWNDLIKTQPNSKLTADASEGLGWINFDAKDFEHARACFQLTAATPNHPRAAWSKLMEGRCLAALGKVDEALGAMKLAPTLSGANKDLEAEVPLRVAEVLLAAGRYPAALDAHRELAKSYPDAPTTVQAIAVAALTCMDNKRPEETIACADLYLNSVKNNPDRATILRLKARALTALGKPSESLATAKQAVDESAAIADPVRKAEEHPASLLLLAETLSDRNAAANQYNDVVKLYPDSRFGLAARYELARIDGQGGKIDEAYQKSKELLEILAKQPADQKNLNELRRDALFAAGEFAFRKQEYKNAELLLKTYHELTGASDVRADDVARKLAWCRRSIGDLSGAIAVLDTALETYPRSTYRDEMLYLRGMCADSSGQTADALRFNDLLIKDFPDSSFALQALYDSAAILFKTGKTDDAIQRLDTLLKNKSSAIKPPLKAAAFQLRATLRLQAGKAGDALTDAQAAMNISDADTDAANKDEMKSRRRAARLLEALALIAQGGKDSDAEAALTSVISEGPADSPEVQQALSRRARLRFDNKKFADAKTDLTLLTAKLSRADEPPSTDTLEAALYLVLCHKELKEAAEAKTLLEKLSASKLSGMATFEVPFQLGNLAFESGDNPAASAQYTKALAATGQIKDFPRENLSAAQLNLAWSLRRANKLEDADKAFSELIKSDLNGAYAAEALYERGRILSELGKLDEAIQTWGQIVEKKPQSPQCEKAIYAQAQSLVQASRFKEAGTAFQQYATKFPQGASLRDALCGLAECQVQEGKLDEARATFVKVLGGKSPDDAELDDLTQRALLGICEITLKQGDAAAAKKLALRILTELPNSNWRDSAYLSAGKCSEALKEPEKAIGYYRKLLSEIPNSPHASAAGERLKALGAPAKESE